MMEMKTKFEAPDLAAAITKLADALTPPDPHTLTLDQPMGAPVPPVAVAPVPAPAAPVNPTPAPTAPAPRLWLAHLLLPLATHWPRLCR